MVYPISTVIMHFFFERFWISFEEKKRKKKSEFRTHSYCTGGLFFLFCGVGRFISKSYPNGHTTLK